MEIEYPRAFFDAMTSTPSFSSRTQPFRHVHLSGAVVESDQTRTLWFFSEGRKARVSTFNTGRSHVLMGLQGASENRILELTNDPKSQGKWTTYVVRPGWVMPPTDESSWFHTILSYFMTSRFCLYNDELALTMLRMAISGGVEPVLSSTEIAIEGRELLTRR